MDAQKRLKIAQEAKQLSDELRRIVTFLDEWGAQAPADVVARLMEVKNEKRERLQQLIEELQQFQHSGEGKKEKRIEKRYDQLFKKMVGLLGNKVTYNTDLDRVGKQVFKDKYAGTFASDQLPQLTDRVPYCILNVDKSHEGGSHWIGVCKVPRSGDVMIYDSFGRKSSELIPHVKSAGGQIVDTDYDAEQRDEETNCGARCMAWIALFDEMGPDAAKLL